MAKVKTIQEKREEMMTALERLCAFEVAINKLDDVLKWDYCTIKHDEDGNAVKDEDGEYVWVAPEESDYGYSRYIAFKGVVDEIKALV